MYIGDYLARRELYSPDRLAIVDTGKSPEWRLTFRQMNERANRLAHWLRDVAGVGKGDRVAILAHDGVEHLDALFACGKLGAIHTALNWRLHPQELADIVARTTPKALIFSDDVRPQVVELQGLLRGHDWTIGHYLHTEGEGTGGSIQFETALDSSSATPVTTDNLEAEDIAALIFTGGTTGLPKAAQVSHRMIAWNTLNTVIHDVTHDDVYLNVFPMFHTGGLFVYTLPQIIFGGTTILMRQFNPTRVLELIERERATIFGAVPTMYQMIAQAPNWAAADLSSLRFCTSGGAPLPVPLVEQYTREKGIRFKQGFGMTEFGPGIFALAPEDAIRKAGSIGRPNFYVDARIVDDDNRFLGPDEEGELVLKGPSYCSGYFHDPVASAEAIDERGFFHTGDMARYDAEGYFYIVDRKKDMYISGGENIYPAEIERVLYGHPDVLMCAVIGLPDAKWGEAGKACVVLKPGATADAAELLAYMADRLAKYKVPKAVAIMDALPISSAGKILKRELKGEPMSSIPTLPGITSRMIPTARINTHVLFSGPDDGEPVVFVHGNASSSTFWEESMLALPPRYRAIAPDLRGYGDTEDLLIDATRGAKDWSEDLRALSGALGERPAHLVGWSLGAAPILQFAMDYPELVKSLTLLNPISPYGFGGTKGEDGVPCYDDFGGSGGGSVNPEFVRRMQIGDRSDEDPNSPRNVINAFYYKPPFRAAREEAFLSSLLSEKTGGDRYPGDLTPSVNWPNVAPGVYGPINATSPKYLNLSGIVDMLHKPPILWIRGDSDQIVSDMSLFDFGTLGKLGAVPGWPGDDVFPPQLMLLQTRTVLRQYEAQGGTYREVVIADAGHSPQVEQPEAFMAALVEFLEN